MGKCGIVSVTQSGVCLPQAASAAKAFPGAASGIVDALQQIHQDKHAKSTPTVLVRCVNMASVREEECGRVSGVDPALDGCRSRRMGAETRTIRGDVGAQACLFVALRWRS